MKTGIKWINDATRHGPEALKQPEEPPRRWIVKWISSDLTNKPYLSSVRGKHVWSASIHKALRMTYAEAFAIIDGQYDGDAVAEYQP